jgi:uncharacterized protein (TIRG00374 family)
MRKQLFISIAVAVVCLYFAFRGISFSQLYAALRLAHFTWIFLGLSVYTCGYLFRNWRWQILIHPIKKVGYFSLLGPLFIGFFANNILPFRIGELVRAHITGQKIKISGSASLGTIFLERICDMIAFLSTFIAAALFFPFPTDAKRAAALLAFFTTIAVAMLLLGIRYQKHLRQWIKRLSLPEKWEIKIQTMVENFIQGISGMHELRYVASALAVSLIVWTLEGTTLFLIVHAFPVAFSWPQAFFLLFFMGLSVTLPQAPGYVGTMEFFGAKALQWLGIPAEMGLAIILTIHAAQFLYIVIVGCLALWHEGLSISGLMATKADEMQSV